jgi:hypothetical protein
MLKDVRIHLDTDEARQHQLEQELASQVIRNSHRNKTAFKTYVPSLANVINHAESENISIFTTKNAEFNIVNYDTGRAFYGLAPTQEIFAQYEEKKNSCTYCSLSEQFNVEDTPDAISSLNDMPIYKRWKQQPPLPDAIDVLVVFGIGLGQHLHYLLENHLIKHLVIYEPEIQYFHCSILSTDWRNILQLADKKSTALYFQLENSGATLFDDINELGQHNSFNGFYLYRHYNDSVFNAVENAIVTTPWSTLEKQGIGKYLRQNKDDILPLWSQGIDLDDYTYLTPNVKFKANIEAFKRYFPELAHEFENFQPEYWLPVASAKGEVNLLSRFSLTPWYGPHPDQDAEINFENFSHYPNKDGLVLGYNGTKLKHYHHFQFVDKTQKLLKKVEEQVGALPEKIKSLILFGIGPQVSQLFAHNTVEHLFICEPNRDLFYASMFSLDWVDILAKIDESSGRLYINVGDDGSNLFQDLLSQFYSIGPYILASTYFYQTYYNQTLVNTISQLREQLQIVISMGENFDHAYYGIAQTREVVRRGYPLLESQPAKKLSFIDKETPIFIVGNGPSLDSSIDAIKECQDKAIIVSCGTALMSLYKNGITPDFHAEIEQNRSTYDWCCRINDFTYLKEINLISCNGIHPDTCELFKNVYVAFKEGESSTVSALNVLGRSNYEELRFAFPTVSNFAVNLFTLMGFNQLYFMGIDLGFSDQKIHHSQQSGYYDDKGQEIYNYNEKNITNLVVPGNFQKTVFTKHEFKVSKVIIERSLANISIDCFNTSNGARIEGTKSLHIDDILLSSSAQQKQDTLHRLTTSVYKPTNKAMDYAEKFAEQYKRPLLEKELTEFIALARQPFRSVDEVEKYTEKQKESLFTSYINGNSLLFYYLYGTVNHANSVFSKLMFSEDESGEKMTYIEEVRKLWIGALEDITQAVLSSRQVFDHVSSFATPRELAILRSKMNSFSIVSYLSMQDNVIANTYIKRVGGNEQSYITPPGPDSSEYAIAKYSTLGELTQGELDNLKCSVILVDENTNFTDLTTQFSMGVTTFLCSHTELNFDVDIDSYLSGQKAFYHDASNITWLIKSVFLSDVSSVIIPKLHFVGDYENMSQNLLAYAEQVFSQFAVETHYVSYPNYIMVPRKDANYNDYIVDNLGNRGVLIKNLPTYQDLFFEGSSVEEGRMHINKYFSNWRGS